VPSADLRECLLYFRTVFFGNISTAFFRNKMQEVDGCKTLRLCCHRLLNDLCTWQNHCPAELTLCIEITELVCVFFDAYACV